MVVGPARGAFRRHLHPAVRWPRPFCFAKVPIGCLATPLLGIGALLLAYQTLAGALNHTTILLAHGQCSVRHGPVPCPGGIRYPVRARAWRALPTAPMCAVPDSFGPVGLSTRCTSCFPPNERRGWSGCFRGAAHAEFLENESSSSRPGSHLPEWPQIALLLLATKQLTHSRPRCTQPTRPLSTTTPGDSFAYGMPFRLTEFAEHAVSLKGCRMLKPDLRTLTPEALDAVVAHVRPNGHGHACRNHPAAAVETPVVERSGQATGRHEANMPSAELVKLLVAAVEREASDVHLVPGYPPTFRIHGQLRPGREELLGADEVRRMVDSLVPERLRGGLGEHKNLDCSVAVGARGTPSRFRASVYLAQGQWCAALRHVPNEIPSLEWLGFPEDLAREAGQPHKRAGRGHRGDGLREDGHAGGAGQPHSPRQHQADFDSRGAD